MGPQNTRVHMYVTVNILIDTGFGIVLYYIFATLPPISTRQPFQVISRLPIFFGTVLFAIEAVGVVSYKYFRGAYMCIKVLAGIFLFIFF